MKSRIRKALSQAQRRTKGHRLTVSVSLPQALVAEIDKARSMVRGLSRSRWIERAIRTLLLGVVALLVQGCAGDVFKVDNRFTREEEQKLQAAADAWVSVGGRPIDLVFGYVVDGHDQENVIVKTNGRGGARMHELFRDRSVAAVTRIHTFEGTQVMFAMDRIDENVPGNTFYATALHEFGHVQLRGGDEVHLDNINAIMFYAPQIDEITAADVAALKARVR